MAAPEELAGLKGFLAWCGFKYARTPLVSQLRAQALFVGAFFSMALLLVASEAFAALKPDHSGHVVTWLIWAFIVLLAVSIGLDISVLDLAEAITPGIAPRSYLMHGGPARRAAREAMPATARETNRYNWALSLGLLALAFITALSGGIVGSPFGQLLIAFFIFGQLLAPLPRATFTLFVVGIIVAAFTAMASHLISEHHIVSAYWNGWYYAPPVILMALASTWVSYTQLAVESPVRREET